MNAETKKLTEDLFKKIDGYDIAIVEAVYGEHLTFGAASLGKIDFYVVGEIGWLKGREKELRDRLQKLCDLGVLQYQPEVNEPHHENEYWLMTCSGKELFEKGWKGTGRFFKINPLNMPLKSKPR